MKKIKYLGIVLLILLSFSSCSFFQNPKILLLDAKTAAGVDEKYQPVNAMDVFPDGTSKVYLWFSWRDAQKNLQLLAKWKYLTEDINILDYPFNVPRRKGQGSVALMMPAGKAFPQGLYQVTLYLGQRELRTVSFKVGENE